MKIARRRMSAEVPSMAMGDIAFNLLIFFVILARAQDDSHLQWKPAQSEKIENAGHPKASIVIDINNKLHLNGREIGVSQLAGELRGLLGDANFDERVVLFKVHKEIQASRFEPAIEAVAEAGGKLVHVLERRSEDDP